MDQEQIIDYLKIKSGGKLVMTPEQLEQESWYFYKTTVSFKNSKKIFYSSQKSWP